MRADPATGPISVSLLALPEGTPFVLFALYEVFSAIGVAWSALTGEPTGAEPVGVSIVGLERKTFACAANVPITPHRRLAEVNRADLVVVPDIAFPPEDDPTGRWPEATAWLRRQYEAGATVCSVCSGTVLLAEAGLLDGREATTHWAYHDFFAHRYPQVKLRLDRVLVAGTDDHRIVTSGSASSWEDLVLYLIARYRGREEALRISRLFLFGDRSEGQLPYAAPSRPRRHEDAAIGRAQEWIAYHYAADQPVQRMAEAVALPPRTFKRRFSAATGLSPLEYVQALRIEEAKQLLERGERDIDAVAEEVGYSDPTFFRRLFKRMAGVTPARYRQRCRAVVREPSESGTRLADARGRSQRDARMLPSRK